MGTTQAKSAPLERTKYCGDVVDGHAHGMGIHRWPSGGRYVGQFEMDSYKGLGIFEWSNGGCFEGQWDENRFEGLGLNTWPDGRTYAGEYENGKKHGRAIQIWPNGDRYEGCFVNDKFHGYGMLTRGGAVYEGVFKDGAMFKIRHLPEEEVKSIRAVSEDAERLAKEARALADEVERVYSCDSKKTVLKPTVLEKRNSEKLHGISIPA